MKKIWFLLMFAMIQPAGAASKTARTSSSSSFTESFKSPPSTPNSAVLSTNVADISRNRANVSIDVFMTQRIAATLSYATSSREETRENLASRPKLTVDRTQFGFGADFYWRPLEAMYNLSLAPALIFETERDAVDTGSTTGLGVKAMGIFKPLPRLLAQGGLEVNILGSETRSNLLVGMGLIF